MTVIQHDFRPRRIQKRRHYREVTSMSDYVHTGRRMTGFADKSSIEARLIFGACYLPFLLRAVVTRLTPWRQRTGRRESIFREASSAASVLVGSSFVGL
jgi:hypothetical protein